MFYPSLDPFFIIPTDQLEVTGWEGALRGACGRARHDGLGSGVSRETTIVIDKHCGDRLHLDSLPLYASFI